MRLVAEYSRAGQEEAGALGRDDGIEARRAGIDDSAERVGLQT